MFKQMLLTPIDSKGGARVLSKGGFFSSPLQTKVSFEDCWDPQARWVVTDKKMTKE